MDVVQRIKDLVLMLMLAAALSIGLAEAQEAPADSSVDSANSAACGVEAVANDGDMSDEWLDPRRIGPDGTRAKYY